MGLLDSLFGGSAGASTSESGGTTVEKYTIIPNAGLEEGVKAANAFNYALEFDRKGYETRLFLDGVAAQWPAEFAENPDRPFSYDWERLQDRELIAGACGYCANGLEVAELAEEGFDVLPVGLPTPPASGPGSDENSDYSTRSATPRCNSGSAFAAGRVTTSSASRSYSRSSSP